MAAVAETVSSDNENRADETRFKRLGSELDGTAEPVGSNR